MVDNSSEISFEGFMVIILVLTIFHVLISGFYVIVTAKNKEYKKCGVWIISFLLITAMLVISSVGVSKGREGFNNLFQEDEQPKKRKKQKRG